MGIALSSSTVRKELISKQNIIDLTPPTLGSFMQSFNARYQWKKSSGRLWPAIHEERRLRSQNVSDLVKETGYP